VHLGEGSGDREDPGIGFEDPRDRLGGPDLKEAGLAQQHDAERVVQLGICSDDAFHRRVSNTPRDRTGKTIELLADVG